LKPYAYLLDHHIISATNLLRAISISKKSTASVEANLINDFQISKEVIGKSLAAFYGCDFVAYDEQMPITIEVFIALDISALLNECWVPLRWDENGTVVLIDDPSNSAKREMIKNELGTNSVIFAVGIQEDIVAFINRSFHELEIDYFFSETISAKKPINKTNFLNTIIADAYLKGASDVQFESLALPERNRVLLRMDGIWRNYMTIPDAAADDTIQIIKSMANLKPKDSHLPKIGRIKFKHQGLPEIQLIAIMSPTGGHREVVTLKIQAV